ncbi:MFS transporter [Chloroflexota bacterium]
MVEDKKPIFFYGYIIVAAGAVIQLLVIGANLSFGIFLTPLSSELGATSAVTSGAYSLGYFLFGFSGIVVGRLTDKFGPRIVLIACGLLLGLGYLLMSQVSSIWQMYLFYGVILGIGMSGSSTPVLSTVARWFVKKRGTVTGITKTGAGIGILAMPLLANWLISSYGWRNAYVVLGIIVLAGVIVAALFLKRDPRQIGLLPDGATEVEAGDSNIGTRQFSLREAIHTRQFWLFSAASFLIMFCAQVVIVHIAPHVIELGISTTVAAITVSVIGGVSILGRIVMGGISDRLGCKPTLIITISFFIVSFVLIQFAQEAWLFYIFATVSGIGRGAFYTLISPMLAELFGLRSLGAILGGAAFLGAIGGALGPALSGRIFDVTGSYQLSFLILLALSIIAIVLISFLRPISNEILRKMHGEFH